MPSRTFSLYGPNLNIGGPVAELMLSDADDAWFEAPDDLNNDNQSAFIDGVPVTINFIHEALGPQVIVAMVDGIEVSLTLTPLYIEVEDGVLDDYYIILPGLPPGAEIISATLPVFTTNSVALPLCLAGEAMVRTAEGMVPAIDLASGMLVHTRDRGLQPVRWVGRRHADFLRNPALRRHAPVVFQPGSIDGRAPHRRLPLSPQHKVLVCGWRAELFFGLDEALVPAKALINGTTVTQQADCRAVDYVHVLFDSHEVISAEGAPVESLFLGDVALGEECRDIREELLALFPEIDEIAAGMTTARTALRYREGRVLAEM